MNLPRTIPELFRSAVERHDKPDFMMYKAGGEYVPISAREFMEEVDLAAHGLIALGIEPGDRVALLSENRPGWAFADLAALTVGAWSVPIYTSLTAPEIQYILEDSGATACFVSTAEQLEKINVIKANCPALHCVIALDPMESDESGYLTARQLIERGEGQRAANPALLAERMAAIDPEKTASLLYTSGTTGQPKGVMLSHRNFVSNVLDSLKRLAIVPGDLHLSFLPLSHSFERTAGYYVMMHAGVTIAYAESVDAVVDNMGEVRPTVMTSVPRLYEKMYAGMLGAAGEAGGVKKRLVFWARRVAIEYADRQVGGRPVGHALAMKHRLADRLVFSKLRARTGGRVRFFISGGAPLAPVIAKFFYGAGLPILEGYGLTETSPVIAVNTEEEMRFGTVGRPIPNVEVRIDEDGEILARGPNIMQGYYKLPEKTTGVLNDDGWFHTGDVGFIDDGYLTITDRKKDLIKTSGGKYIAPQPLENALKLSKFVSQAVVIGDRRKYACTLIVPNFENLLRWAAENDLPESPEELVRDPAVSDVYDELLAKINAGKASFETLKKYRLLPTDFTIESGELTPTLKVKRRVIEERYRDVIDTMYEDEGIGVQGEAAG